MRKLFSTIFGIAVLSTLLMPANAQVTDQAAREQASNIVRSELRTTLNLKPDQFLDVQRDEALEKSLALAVGRVGSAFIYRASPSGDEIKGAAKASPSGNEIRENTVVHHIVMDGDPMHIIAVASADGSAYRIHGFGRADSLAEFEKLMTALKVRVASADQAEAIADFYRRVNPGNHEGLAPIVRLMELKQAAERQCQSGVKSFDAGEKAFATWWKRAEPLYGALPFEQKAVPHGGGYLVEWIVLSSPSGENCGGAPLRAQLEISSDGRVGKVTFSPLQPGTTSSTETVDPNTGNLHLTIPLLATAKPKQ
jgi:hypothetical protein